MNHQVNNSERNAGARATERLFETFKGQAHGVVITIIILVLIVLLLFAAGKLDDLREFLMSEITQVPGGWATFMMIFIASVILSIIWVAVGTFFQWYFKIPGTLDKVRSWFDPITYNSPIKPFVEKLVEPNDPSSPFFKTLHQPDGMLPSTVIQIQNHIHQVESLLHKLSENIKTDGQIAENISQSHSEFQTWGEDWRKIANGALTMLEKDATLRNMMLLKPYEYISFLQNADEFHYEQNFNRHVGTITLYGTMVGFAFLLPEALRNHACRSQRDFSTLQILASDICINSESFVIYPLYLACQVVREMLFNCSIVRKITLESGTSKHEFDIEIRYIPHDLFDAGILMEKATVAVLQALDIKSFVAIIEGRRRQIGFEYKNTRERTEEYDRYAYALKNMWEKYRVQRKTEKWKICMDAPSKSVKLRISNPHWVFEDGNMASIIQAPEDYDHLEETKTINIVGDESIKKFLNSCASTISSGHLGINVRDLSHRVDILKKSWSRFVDFNCHCEQITRETQLTEAR